MIDLTEILDKARNKVNDVKNTVLPSEDGSNNVKNAKDTESSSEDAGSNPAQTPQSSPNKAPEPETLPEVQEKEPDNRGILTGDDKLKEELKEHIREAEGKKENIYMDPSGVPTVGYGTALGKIDQNNNVEVYSKETIDKMLQDSGNPPLSDAQYQSISNSVGKWNSASKKERIGMRGADVAGYTLKNDEVLLSQSIDRSLGALEQSASDRQVDLRNMPDAVKMSVADTYYRGGENLILGNKQSNTEYIQRGEWGNLAGEIQYRSNKEEYAGNDKRNTTNSKRILDALPEERRSIDKWKVNHPRDVEKVNKRWERYKQEPNKPWAQDMQLSFAPTQQKSYQMNSLTTEQNRALDGGKRVASVLACEAMDGNVKTSSQKEMHGRLTETIGRVMMDLDDGFENSMILAERPDLIRDENLRGGHTDNEITFKGIKERVQSEMQTMARSGNAEDPAETIKRTVMDSFGSFKFDTKNTFVAEREEPMHRNIWEGTLVADDEELRKENRRRGRGLFDGGFSSGIGHSKI